MQVKTVLRGGLAEAAGFASGDEWLGVELPGPGGAARSVNRWRISRLDELAFYAGRARKVGALVARDKRLLTLPLTLPKADTTWRLVARDAKLVAAWLEGSGG